MEGGKRMLDLPPTPNFLGTIATFSAKRSGTKRGKRHIVMLLQIIWSLSAGASGVDFSHTNHAAMGLTQRDAVAPHSRIRKGIPHGYHLYPRGSTTIKDQITIVLNSQIIIRWRGSYS